MKIVIQILLFSICSNFVFSQTFSWAKNINSTLTQGKKIRNDQNGNIFTVGNLYGCIADMDFGPAVNNLAPGIGNNNSYIAKYNTNGDLIWAKLLFSQNFDNKILDLQLDSNSNVLFIGKFKGTIDFDPGIGVFNLTNTNLSNYEQLFIEKMDSNGNFLWAKTIGDTSSYTINPSCAIDNVGNFYIVDAFVGTIDFDPGASDYFMTSSPNPATSNTYILKLNSNGQFEWAKQLVGGANSGVKINIDNNQNIFIIGKFQTSIDADPNIGVASITGSSNNNVYIIKLNSITNLIWAKHISAINFFSIINIIDIQIDVNNSLYYLGSFSDSVNFSTGPIGDVHVAAGAEDVYLSKLDSSGNYFWTRSYGNTNNDIPKQLIVDSVSNCYILGSFAGILDFDPSANAVYNMTGQGTYISMINLNGNFMNVHGFGTINGTGSILGQCISKNSDQRFFMTGHFQGTQDFDPGAGIFNLTSPGVGNFMFIEKFGFCGTYHDSSITHCNTINLWGTNYDSSQQFVQMFSDGNECDSNINVNLTIIYGPTDTLNQTECNNFTINNVTYTTAGLHVQNFPIGGACDSLFVINLSLLNPGTINITQAVDTLQAYPSGYTYQWLDCTTNLPIAGATDSVYVPSGNGSYKAVVYFGANCSDTTGCKAISKGEGVNDFSLANFSIKPNPTEGHFEIVNKGYKGSLAVKITDIFGKKIFLKEFKQNDNLNFNLNNFCNGLYIIELDVEKRTLFFKIVKQQ